MRPSTVSEIGRTAIRLACYIVSNCRAQSRVPGPYIFDIWARVHGDHIAVLHAQVMSHNTVDTGAPIIEVVIGQNDQHGIPSHLTLDEDCVATEELEGLHGIIREGDDGIVIVDGVSDTVASQHSRKDIIRNAEHLQQ